MIAYKGPGFYNEIGEQVCTFHPESMKEFIDMAIDGYWTIHASKDYEEMTETIRKEAEPQLWTTPEDDWQDVVAPQIGTGRPDE